MLCSAEDFLSRMSTFLLYFRRLPQGFASLSKSRLFRGRAPPSLTRLFLQRYHVPKYLSEDARFLIAGMLVVDPMKRLSIQDLLEHRWTNVDLPDYLKVTQDQLNPGRRPDTLTSLLDASASANGPDWIEDIGLLDNVVLEELATSLNVPPSVVRTSLELEGENSVKVAYKLIQDRTILKNREFLPLLWNICSFVFLTDYFQRMLLYTANQRLACPRLHPSGFLNR